MRPTPIHSKWHKIADPMKCNIALAVNDYHGFDNRRSMEFIDADVIKQMFTLYDTLPKYVIYDDIVKLVFEDNGPIQKSVRSMIQANVAHLPYPELMVEFTSWKEVTGEIRNKLAGFKLDGDVLPIREFVWLGENPKGHLKGAEDYPFFAQPMTMVEPAGAKYPLLILNPNCIVGKYLLDGAHDGTNKLGLEYKAHLSPFVKYKSMTPEMREGLRAANVKDTMWSASCAITAIIALLRTRGVVQDRIEAPAKLNKSRAAAGKTLIRDHTVLRIGHVYDRAGNQVAYNPTGRTMPVHWRAGHVRNQRFGPQLSKSYEVFIDPMLVNYVEGDTVPVPVKEVTV